MRLFLVRHPRPVLESGICYGSADVQVGEEAIEQAAAVLLPQLPREIPVYSSPLQRCWRLADRLAAGLQGSTVLRDARLAEVNFGNWELRKWEDIPREEVDAWAADVTGYRPGEGETVIEAASRVLHFLRDLEEQAVPQALIVCHAGTIRLLLGCDRTSGPEQVATRAAGVAESIPFGSLTILDQD